jgi:hypothetical protein
MTMDGCERRKTEPFVVRFMTTVQSSLGWRKLTLRFIVVFKVSILGLFRRENKKLIVAILSTRNCYHIHS